MEEVDNIIIHTLKQIGCDLEDEVCSLKGFSTKLVVEAAGRCLRLIDADSEPPMKLPPSMSARFRVGTTLAKLCTDLGYRGEIGYQTFLYSNENEVRKVLMFLIEKLPKETVVTSEEPAAASEILKSLLSEKLKVALSSPWTPPFCKNKGIAWRGSGGRYWQRESNCYIHPFHSVEIECQKDLLKTCSEPVASELRRQYYNEHLPSVRGQCGELRLAPSLIHCNAVEVSREQQWELEWNSVGLQSRLTPLEYRAQKHEALLNEMSAAVRSGVAAAHGDNDGEDNDDFAVECKELHALLLEELYGPASGNEHKQVSAAPTEPTQQATELGDAQATSKNTEIKVLSEEELNKLREEELENLKVAFQQLNETLTTLESDVKSKSAEKQQLEGELKHGEEDVTSKKELYKVKKKTIDLLPDAEANIEKLQSLISSSNDRLSTLAEQWEAHRGPLMKKYEELKQANYNRVTEQQRKLNEIKSMRERIKEMANDVRNKEELQKQLKAEYEKMSKDVNRSFYTKRIMEIIASIKKQKTDIDKILIDTRARQKEINQLTGKLDRTFTVTDELIFKDAKRDDEVRKAYKFLAALHQSFNILVMTVEDTGSILREIRDLEDQIESDDYKKTDTNLEQIMIDYKQMKEENQTLLQKLKNSKVNKNT